MQQLAIYDMDRTITRSGTYTPFLIFVAKRRAPWRLLLLPIALVFMGAYAVQLISRSRLKELNLALLIGGRFRLADIQKRIEQFADRVIRDNIYTDALAQVEADRKAGHRLVLATASYHLYVDEIARRLGFDDVIATELESGAGTVRARIRGENCYDAAKLRKITIWMDAQGLSRANCTIRAYSDHFSDIPMLTFADVPIATNPSLLLRNEAQKRGWLIYLWK